MLPSQATKAVKVQISGDDGFNVEFRDRAFGTFARGEAVTGRLSMSALGPRAARRLMRTELVEMNGIYG
jgi:hypothetical protein